MAQVTAVVPTRNRRAFLTRTVDSVLGQLGVEVRLVVVDEGSSDDTPAYLAEMAAADVRVRVLRHDEPRGVAGARNAGIDVVATHWVAFCDDDDLWALDKLRAQLAAIADEPGARWSCVGAVHIGPDDAIVGHQHPPASGDSSEIMRAYNAVPGGGSGLLVETALVRHVGGYDKWFTGCEDFELAVKLAIAAPVATVDRPLLGHRLWPDTMSSNVPLMREGHRRVLQRWRGDLPVGAARIGDDEERRYFTSLLLRNGSRWAAARGFAGLAIRQRQPRRLGTAALSVVVPRTLVARHDQTAADEVPPAWRDEARRWLPERS